MKKLALVAALFAATAAGGEREESARWCAAAGGEAEYRTASGERIDCWLASPSALHPARAVEVEWSHKPYEGVGQALFYAAQMKNELGEHVVAVVLLLRHPRTSDAAHARGVRRARLAAARAGVWVLVR